MVYQQNIEMSPEEYFEVIQSLKNKIEENFVQLGEIFSQMKRRKLFKLRGYKNIKEYLESELNFPGSLASKLINNYELYVEEMELDEKALKEIGFDKLNIVKPFIKNNTIEEQENWLSKAGSSSIIDLKEEIKAIKEKEKQSNKTLKEEFTEQYLEKMVVHFNCSIKELNYKLALYFQDEDLDEIKAKIKQKQLRYEEELEKK